jgi:F0F1-type ATP synthase assembly protein I
MGVSQSNFTFWASVGTLSDSVSGVVGGFYLGRILDTKWGMFFGDADTRALIWIIFVLIGVAAVVWFGNKTRKG